MAALQALDNLNNAQRGGGVSQPQTYFLRAMADPEIFTCTSRPYASGVFTDVVHFALIAGGLSTRMYPT
jgi:hypothetical protein